jgi:hypothetical protein
MLLFISLINNKKVNDVMYPVGRRFFVCCAIDVHMATVWNSDASRRRRKTTQCDNCAAEKNQLTCVKLNFDCYIFWFYMGRTLWLRWYAEGILFANRPGDFVPHDEITFSFDLLNCLFASLEYGNHKKGYNLILTIPTTVEAATEKGICYLKSLDHSISNKILLCLHIYTGSFTFCRTAREAN